MKRIFSVLLVLALIGSLVGHHRRGRPVAATPLKLPSSAPTHNGNFPQASSLEALPALPDLPELSPLGRPAETAEERDALARETEAYQSLELKKHPGAQSRFDYAEFLVRQDRFMEAGRELSECLGFAECGKNGAILKEGIDRALASSDPEGIRSAKAEVSMRLLDSDLEARAAEPGDNPAPPPPRPEPSTPSNAPPKEAAPSAAGYVPSDLERDRLLLAWNYEADAEPGRAADEYDRILADHRDSPFANVEYVRFLLRQGDGTTARDRLSQIQDAYPEFRDEPEWKALTQAFARMPGKSATEIDNQLRSSLDELRRQADPYGVPYLEPVYSAFPPPQ